MTVAALTDYLRERATDPAPAFIMQREILMTPPDDPIYVDAYQRLKQSKHYAELASEQQADGSWGRFHSQDTKLKVKRRFVTTEQALRRACELGLPTDDPVVASGVSLMERYIMGAETWPDAVEQHRDNGRSHMRARPFLTAALMNLVSPGHPAVKPLQDVFVATLDVALARGAFDEAAWEAENRAYRGPCLTGWNAFAPMMLYNANLNDTTQRLYLSYLWDRPGGIYYLAGFPAACKHNADDKSFGAWLGVLENLSGFSLFPEFARPDVYPHLLNEAQRVIDGCEIPKSYNVRYSENWRDGNKRGCDLLLRMLRLLVHCE